MKDLLTMTESGVESWGGGARIGEWNLTIPFARLSVRSGCLVLAITGSVFGIPVIRLAGSCPHHLVFSVADVSGLEVIGHIPVFSVGICIHHLKPEYPEKPVFWCGGTRGSAHEIVERLAAHGFPATVR